nr:hypothetical protein B0A51_13756 [Rachicladosporium sp. CCFEE 5018]
MSNPKPTPEEATSWLRSSFASLSPEDRIRSFLAPREGESNRFYSQFTTKDVTLRSITKSPEGLTLVTYAFPVSEFHCNMSGNMHGGFQSTAFDMLTSLAIMANLEPGNPFMDGGVSRTLSVTYLRPAPLGEMLVMECEVTHVGKRMAMTRGLLKRERDGAVGHDYVGRDPLMVENHKTWSYAARDLLEKRSYSMPLTTRGPALQEMLERSERHLLHYENCTTAELCGFISVRALGRELAITPATPRSKLKSLLMAADDNLTFSRFIDLPPELREQICEHYFDEYEMDYKDMVKTKYLPNILVGPNIAWYTEFPPVVYCNRQLRQEVLPLYWSRLKIDVSLFADCNGSSRDSPTDVSWSPPESHGFRLAHDTGMLSCIRSLCILFDYSFGAGRTRDHEMVFLAVDLMQGTARLECGPDDRKAGLAKRLIGVIDPLLQDMRTRPGTGGKLQLGDGKKVKALLASGGSLMGADVS